MLARRRAEMRERRRRRRQWWVRPWILRRPELGLYDRLMVELRNEDPASFHNFMRMTPAMYDEIVARLTPHITKQSTKMREPLEPGLKVALTLRHLAAGSTYKDMQYGWRVPHNTISKVVREVCQAIVDEYTEEQLSMPETEEEWKAIANAWYKRWNFPHTIGAIDGKHIACRKPENSGSEYWNYKKYYSIILFAMVTSDYKFLYVDVTGTGSLSDAQIYNASDLRAGLENNDIVGWPQPDPLPHDTEDMPYFIVGDDAFSLRTYLMKPYKNRCTREERIFNYRLSRARRVVENAFGILANRFQLLLTTMKHEPETVALIVKACVLLHNLMRTRYPVLQNQMVDREDRDNNMNHVPGAWRREGELDDTIIDNIVAPNRPSKMGKAQRNLIKHWVNSPVGSVPWQDRQVGGRR